jgi:hypothetical protein
MADCVWDGGEKMEGRRWRDGVEGLGDVGDGRLEKTGGRYVGSLNFEGNVLFRNSYQKIKPSTAPQNPKIQPTSPAKKIFLHRLPFMK